MSSKLLITYFKPVEFVNDNPSPVGGDIWYNQTEDAYKIHDFGSHGVGVWATETNLISVLRDHTGSGNSSGFITTSETLLTSWRYDGVSWSTGADQIAYRGQALYAGVSDASHLLFGGYNTTHKAETYHFDGTAFSSGGSLATSRYNGAGCGTESNALAISGTGAVTRILTVESYNGIIWSAETSVATGIFESAALGVPSAAIRFGNEFDSSTTEEYDGASWSVGGAYTVGVSNASAAGTLLDGLGIGGATSATPGMATVNGYNGTAWSAENSLLTGVGDSASSSGASSDVLVCGGTLSNFSTTDVCESFIKPPLLTTKQLVI